ncbi:MAG: hypothetical protein HYY40_06250 [Bacteroidetes bacterium]|nr:hypothetical protein [Bacteroidota bacterium]
MKFTCIVTSFPLIGASLFLHIFFASSQDFTLLERNSLIFRESGEGNGTPPLHSAIKPWVALRELSSVTDSVINRITGLCFLVKNSPGNEQQVNGFFLMDNRIGITGKSPGNRLQYSAGTGLSMRFRDKFGLEYCLMGGELTFPDYMNGFIRTRYIYPGYGFMDTTNVFIAQRGLASWQLSPYFRVQAGYDKNFWGDGYRSLILSDLAAPYPFFKITADFWRMRYVSLHASLRNIRLITYADRVKPELIPKYGTFHILHWNISNRFSMSVFEAIIWKGTDENLERKYDINYLNPVIFYRPVEYSTGSNDNALMGLNLTARPFGRITFYGQWLLDEFLLKEMKADVKRFVTDDDSSFSWGWYSNKYGLQGGIKYPDAFGINRLHLQVEFNRVRPYTYSHANAYQNYSHMNQPLAHPMGSNFREMIALFDYNYRKWYVNAEAVYAIMGTDSGSSNWGGDIFKPIKTREREYYNENGQGVKTDLKIVQIKAGYLISASSNLYAEAGFIYRISDSILSVTENNYLWIGIRTRLFNEYFDY